MPGRISVGPEAPSNASQDRVTVIDSKDVAIIAVADGAGGTTGGAAAAQLIIDEICSVANAPFTSSGHDAVATLLPRIGDSQYWCDFLASLDRRLADEAIGQSTAVVLAVTATHVIGASVGDSEAWLITATEYQVLTANQRRKPLLGDGVAIVVPISAPLNDGLLLVATDGLFKYASPTRICVAARHRDLHQAASLMINAARLPTGGLQDDIAITICRPMCLGRFAAQ